MLPTHRRPLWTPWFALLVSSALFILFSYSISLAAPPQQGSTEVETDGQEYVVQRGDWLSRISQRFYGDTSGVGAIVEATNAKAATDPRFDVIEDPDEIEVGQLLWIPDSPDDVVVADEEAAGEGSDEEEMTETEAISATATLTVTETLSESIDGSDGMISDTVEAGGEVVSPTVRFAAPLDGDEVPLRFEVAMAAEGLLVEPAGEIRPGAGHFHILVDTDFIPAGELVPFDEQHLHFGRGQLTTTLELEPGEHLLRLQFANGAHIALEGEQYQDTITVTVAAPDAATDAAVPDAGSAAGDEALPSVSFVEPQDGDEVSPRFDVVMAVEGLTVEPAGEIHEGAGHLHILVDTDFVPADELLPFDEQHLHFGRGQLTTTLELEPGVHTLNLQFANGAHIALEGEPYRDSITVTVVEE